ncbi:MAG: hypothetical protein WBL82_15710 [Terriglobales bacterium]
MSTQAYKTRIDRDLLGKSKIKLDWTPRSLGTASVEALAIKMRAAFTEQPEIQQNQ